MFHQVNLIQLQYVKFDDMLFFALFKIIYKSWLNSELTMEKTPSRASQVLKILDSISSVSRNALISCWNRVRGL